MLFIMGWDMFHYAHDESYKKLWRDVALSAVVAVGFNLFIYSLPLSTAKPDHDSSLQKLRARHGDSTLVRILEGHVEPGWSPVDMNLYIPPEDKEK